MKPLTMIYWTRAGLGFIIGVLCSIYLFFSVTSDLLSIYTLLTGISFAILFYIATFYIVKYRFFQKIEKQSKLLTQGIGIYFFAWIISWTLIITIIMPSASVNIFINDAGGLADEQEFWVVAENTASQIVQNVTTMSGTLRMALLPPGTYTFKLGNTAGYNVTNQNQQLTIDWLESSTVNFNVTLLPE